MEGRERRSSARLIRKPLSNISNTLSHRNISPSLSTLKSHTLNTTNNNNNNKPPTKKPTNYTTNKIQNPNRNKNKNDEGADVVSNSSVKSHTSTGSNNSPASDSVPSLPPPRLPRPRHAAAAPVQGDRGHKTSRPSSAQIQRQDEQTRKDKEKTGGTPDSRTTTLIPSKDVEISTSTASGNDSGASRPPAVEDFNLDEQRRKEKGKMIVETPIIQITIPLTSQERQASSSAVSGNRFLPGPSTVYSQKLDAQPRKDKAKMVQENPSIEASDPETPRSLIVSSSAASGTKKQGKVGSIVYNQRRSRRSKMHPNASITLPLSCPPDKRMKNKRVEVNDGGGYSRSGSRTDPLPAHKKKRSGNKHDDSLHAMPQEEVKKLKAYFDDIDAFELPEEVASESELE